jgi:hypothetical protein
VNQFTATLRTPTTELLLCDLLLTYFLSSFCYFCGLFSTPFPHSAHPLISFSLFFLPPFPTSSPYVFFPPSKQLHMSSICVGYGARTKRRGDNVEVDEVLLCSPFITPNSQFLRSRQAIMIRSLFSFSVTPPHSQYALSFLFAPRDLGAVKILECILGVSPARQQLAWRRM